jgi:hypothetical protein
MLKVAAASLVVTSALLLPAPTPALADQCAATSVSARGEESRYLWMAKTKARASWRHKVRATTGLGPSYANWARAENTEERCLSGPSGTLCIFSGTPCRP